MKFRRKIDAGADRTGPQAADEIVESEEDEHAGERAPQRRRIEHECAGRERIENDEWAEEPALRHQEMVGPDPVGSRLLVDEIGDAVADEGRNGIDERLAH
jgi:hypothetical protein